MMLADQTVIDAMQSGAREISCGYSCDLEWGDGVTPDGLAYHAKQRAISINHIAVVLKGRAGSECRIGDSAMTYSSSLDRQTADHNSFLRMTGRTTPVHVTDRVREVADQIAREAEQKRLRNNAYVDSLVTDRRVQTAAMIESSGVSGSGDVARAVRDSALDGARAVRDLARLGVYS
jgi:hypothetical protein